MGSKPLLTLSQSFDHGTAGASSNADSDSASCSNRAKSELLSSQSFNDSKSSHQFFAKKGLTFSCSIGNIVQVVNFFFLIFRISFGSTVFSMSFHLTMFVCLLVCFEIPTL